MKKCQFTLSDVTQQRLRAICAAYGTKTTALTGARALEIMIDGVFETILTHAKEELDRASQTVQAGDASPAAPTSGEATPVPAAS